MPNTRLILHVKGTQAETAELPKEVVRTAISTGQLGLSQLIWSPGHNAWKQARELPELLPGENLILHVKGTQAETTEVPKRAVRAAISKGDITHSQLIWSAKDHTWKQVRELPDLLPSQQLAPAPARVVPVPRAVDAIIPESPSNPVARAAAATEGPPRVRVAGAPANVPHVRVAVAAPPRVRVAGVEVGQPQVRVAAVVPTPAGAPQVRVAAAAPTPVIHAGTPVSARPAQNFTVKEEEDGSHPLKWVCIGLGIAILLVLGGNYLLVNRPLVSDLGQTSYAGVPVHAHLGAFLQPNVIVIHIRPSATVTPDNLVDFLVALAHSTPTNPITNELFDRVALTSGWTAQYSFSGFSWKELGEMKTDAADQRKEFIMAQMADGGGQPLMPESTLSEEAQQARRDQVWAAFQAHFVTQP